MTTDPSRDPKRLGRATLHALVDKLCDLSDLTDPDRCADPENVGKGKVLGKDKLARWALVLTRVLVTSTSKWAFDHIAGRELSVEKLSPNSHDHEILGARYRGGDDPELDRRIFCVILDHLRAFFPISLCGVAAHALRALSAGEVQPFAKASTTGWHHKPYSLAKARLMAVQYVYFLVEQRFKRYGAEETVAQACGVSVSTLRSWERRDLPKILGRAEITDAIDWARRAGAMQLLFERERRHFREGDAPDLVAYLALDGLMTRTLAGIGREIQGLLREQG